MSLRQSVASCSIRMFCRPVPYCVCAKSVRARIVSVWLHVDKRYRGIVLFNLQPTSRLTLCLSGVFPTCSMKGQLASVHVRVSPGIAWPGSVPCRDTALVCATPSCVFFHFFPCSSIRVVYDMVSPVAFKSSPWLLGIESRSRTACWRPNQLSTMLACDTALAH